MKRHLTILATLAMIVCMAASALARGPGWQAGDRPRAAQRPAWQAGACANLPDLTPEQRNQLNQLRQKHFDATAETRAQLQGRRAELGILFQTTAPDPARLQGLQKEINELQAKMADARLQYRLEVKRIAPDAQAFARKGPGLRHPYRSARGYSSCPSGPRGEGPRAW